MHPNEVKAEPGNCSICGMTLVAGDPMATADYRMSVVSEPRAREGRTEDQVPFHHYRIR